MFHSSQSSLRTYFLKPVSSAAIVYMLHVIERFTRPNKGTLHYEALIDDPGAYSKPWTVAWNIPWNADGELTEYICQENNRYLQKLTDDFGQSVISGR